MSLSNVLKLARVYSRAGRLISKNNFRKYREKRWEVYAIYALAVALGALGGGGFGYLYTITGDASARQMLYQAIVGFFITLPTLSILYSLFMTMMSQIRQTGVKAQIQPLYWFPVTWEEHTAASALSSTFGGALWISIMICTAVIAVSIPTGLLPLAMLTVLAIFLSMAMASLTMEAFRAVLAAISGAVLKSTGKAAVWIRFFVAILSFIIIYVAYFTAYTSTVVVIDAIGKGQISAWFIPYVWPGIALYTFSKSMWLYTVLLAVLSIIFAVALFAAAVRLNSRYGLADAPTISVSRIYKPNEGLLNKLGLSPAESAIIKKDFRAFTRRSELRYVFIMPIVLVAAVFVPLITGNKTSSGGLSGSMGTFYYIYLAILPAVAMSMTLGISLVGSEGERLWFLATSPLTVKKFVRAKFFFQAILCTAMALLFGVIGYFLLGPTARYAATGIVEAVILVFAAGMVSLSCGIAGADFRELPRPRMIRTEWSLISTVLVAITGLCVLLPVLAYDAIATMGLLSGGSVNGAFLYLAWLVSGAIGLGIGYIFYGISISKASKLMMGLE